MAALFLALILTTGCYAAAGSGWEEASSASPQRQKPNGTIATLLPPEMLEHVFFFLDIKALGRANQVCRQFRSIINDQLTVSRFLHVKFPHIAESLANTPCMKLRVGPDVLASERFLTLKNYTDPLPKSIFASLGSLTYLNCRGYKGILPEGVFDALESLTCLHLSGYTGILPEGVFDALGNLRVLNFYRCTGAFPEGVFTSLESLRYLTLYRTGPLPQGVFASLGKLEH
ncbi:F-box-like domain-containing protein, partial [Alphaproteobacteria bacterium]|nr:F-box-like domain-containing protein [Alphaproteobacteria bacterium]